MSGPPRNVEALLRPQRDRSATLYVDEELAVEDEEQLVLVVCSVQWGP
jgi:hypothetical protein